VKTGLLILLIIVSGCTITKRVHRSGYHIEWHKHYKKSSSSLSDDKEKKAHESGEADVSSTNSLLLELADTVEFQATEDSETTDVFSDQENGGASEVKSPTKSERAEIKYERAKSLLTKFHTQRTYRSEKRRRRILMKKIFLGRSFY
jgi:hypothetical protein